MKLNFKFTATSVDEIEQARQLPIQNCIGDTSIKMLALFLQKGLVNDNGNVGVSKSVALSKIDEYLEENDTDNLIFDITEALVNAGFLSREMDISKMRELKSKKLSEAMEAIDNEV